MSDSNRADKTTTPSSKYPDHQVWYTHGGIRFEVGNEAGKETVKMFHPSGSYTEWYPDGKTMQFTVGENKQYNKGGVTVTVDENNDVHIKGHSKIQIGGGAHIEVAGDAGIVCGGTVGVAGLGDIGIRAKNIYLGAEGDLNIHVAGKTNITSVGNFGVTTQADASVTASGDASYAAGGETAVNSGQNTNINASGDVVTKGASTKVQGGGASAPPTTFK
jgi:hypothetical protein